MPEHYLRHTPRAPLASCVQCLWYWEGAPRGHAKERLLPNGESSIIFNLRDDPIRIYDAADLTRFESYGCAVLSGARASCFAIDTCQQERVIGIQFRAGGAFPFFRMPASEFEEQSIDLEALWPGRARVIRERLLDAPDPEAMLQRLEHCLTEQLVLSLELHPAVTYALREFRRSSHARQVTAVTDRTGLSPRRFIELFRNQVGLAPKIFCRVRRFQRVLQAVHDDHPPEWAQIALACGYYDQSHFTHEFRWFSGMTPGQYLTAATDHLNHVPLR